MRGRLGCFAPLATSTPIDVAMGVVSVASQ
jgi:hypothetical protein